MEQQSSVLYTKLRIGESANNNDITTGTTGGYTVRYSTLLTLGNSNDTIRMNLNGVTMDVSAGISLSLPIETVSVVSTMSLNTSNSSYIFNTGTTYNVSSYAGAISKEPGILLIGTKTVKTYNF